MPKFSLNMVLMRTCNHMSALAFDDGKPDMVPQPPVHQVRI